MDTNGRYSLVMWTPSGERSMELVVTDAGARMTGVDGNLHDVLNFKRSGRRLLWRVKVATPLPMKLSFDVTVEGDDLSGHCKPGIFPPSPVHGSRTAPPDDRTMQ